MRILLLYYLYDFLNPNKTNMLLFKFKHIELIFKFKLKAIYSLDNTTYFYTLKHGEIFVKIK